jgi:hypothetical protein
MNVEISAPKQDQGTAHIAELIRGPLEQLSKALSLNYGGEIEHLLIELELVPLDADHRKAWSFRYQKLVAPPRFLKGLNLPKRHNVGHYSVRPDYFSLAEVPTERVVPYILGIIYESTAVLEQKRKQLPGFNAQQFRANFAASCDKLGYSIANA